ncbi:MAG: hypothetical protein J4G03_05435 [Gemmatimonadetes bacterium]|nr:hypothetical protein [Gemmatimonadota bacterium]
MKVEIQNLRYGSAAYGFVLEAVRQRLGSMSDPRHLSGPEVADAARCLAVDRFGPMARPVLEHWGIHGTSDIGEIVFDLVDARRLIARPEDSRRDFEALFSFDKVFEDRYPWGN